MAMISCPECGKEISDKAVACIHCGCPMETTVKFCRECGKEISDKAAVCIHCGCPVEEIKNVNSEVDAPSIGLNILSFFFPLVGLILYIVYNDKSPLKAKAIGKWAIIGFVIELVLSVISYVLSFSVLMW